MLTLGVEVSSVAPDHDGLTGPTLTSAIVRAVRYGLVIQEYPDDLFGADVIISAEENRHAVVEVSLTADRDDIDRAETRAGIMAAITVGSVTPVVITPRLIPTPAAQAKKRGWPPSSFLTVGSDPDRGFHRQSGHLR